MTAILKKYQVTLSSSRPQNLMLLGHSSHVCWQDEVDVQTRRARAAEKAFVSLYRDLYVAPDPVPALASALNAGEPPFRHHETVFE